MNIPSLNEGGDGLQPVRLFNRNTTEEKGEGVRLVCFPGQLTNLLF